jgi:hypothetical protein
MRINYAGLACVDISERHPDLQDASRYLTLVPNHSHGSGIDGAAGSGDGGENAFY